MVLALDPPVVASATDTGLVLDITTITIADPLGRGEPHLQLRDGSTVPLPLPLRDWAMSMLVTHHHRADEEVPVFPLPHRIRHPRRAHVRPAVVPRRVGGRSASTTVLDGIGRWG